MPKVEEIEIIKTDIKLDIPNDISEERIEMFLKETSIQTKRSIESIKKRASENIYSFIKVFRSWEEKKFPSDERESTEAVYA